MARSIKVHGTEIIFPNVCVACSQPAQQIFIIERIFTYGQRTITITLPVPMCQDHHDLATRKSNREKIVTQTGLVLGILVDLVVTAGLIFYWLNSGQGFSIVNILVAVIVGSGFFLTVWVATAFWLAPHFASPDSKAARNAVHIEKYWPAQNILQLKFTNDQVCDMVTKENTSILSQ